MGFGCNVRHHIHCIILDETLCEWEIFGTRIFLRFKTKTEPCTSLSLHSLDLIQKSALLPLCTVWGSHRWLFRYPDETGWLDTFHPPYLASNLYSYRYINLQPPYSYSTPTLSRTPYSYLILSEPSAAQHTIPNHPPMRPLCMWPLIREVEAPKKEIKFPTKKS